MLKKDTPPYLTTLLLVNIVNIIFSSYFISFLLAGVVFKIFSASLRNEHNYLLTFCIITFLVIENTQGFKLFSLTLIALVIYFFIIPKLKQLFSSSLISGFIFIFIFYTFVYFMEQITNPFDMVMLIKLIINFVIDIIIVGLVL